MEKKKHKNWIFWKKEIITRSGDEKNIPYLERRTLLRTPWFQVLLHKFLISDDDCLHDHPWAFLSFIFWGGYWEWCYLEDLKGKRQIMQVETESAKFGPQGVIVKAWKGFGSLLYRPAEWRHRVEIPKPGTRSLLITFKKERTWGFWTREGFVHYSKYDSQSRCD